MYLRECELRNVDNVYSRYSHTRQGNRGRAMNDGRWCTPPGINTRIVTSTRSGASRNLDEVPSPSEELECDRSRTVARLRTTFRGSSAELFGRYPACLSRIYCRDRYIARFGPQRLCILQMPIILLDRSAAKIE